ncbi:MAG: RluA family pseudouridine synthase [Comamonas sp.]
MSSKSVRPILPEQAGGIGLVHWDAPAEDQVDSGEDAAGDVDAAEWETRAVVAGVDAHGLRLDKALALWVPEFSRSYLQALLLQGAVLVNGKQHAKPSSKVKVGDAVSVELRPTQQSQAFLPQDIPLDVVYEDAHFLIVNKPAGMVVHPAPGNWSGTLLNALLAHDAKAAQLPRAGIVHRLDKDTSGLMVVARDRQTMDALVRLIAARDVNRNYVALAHKPWVGVATKTVALPIGRDPRNRLRMAVVDLAQHAGKPAKTDFRLLASAPDACLVFCKLHTGRTHQIRVHMASLHHPLLADALYGGVPAAGMERQALHALRLAFVHPVTGEAMSWFALPPSDMLRAMENLDIRYNLQELA